MNPQIFGTSKKETNRRKIGFSAIYYKAFLGIRE
jgi:hypothetical protein